MRYLHLYISQGLSGRFSKCVPAMNITRIRTKYIVCYDILRSTEYGVIKRTRLSTDVTLATKTARGRLCMDHVHISGTIDRAVPLFGLSLQYY